jgi:hypothetical protein
MALLFSAKFVKATPRGQGEIFHLLVKLRRSIAACQQTSQLTKNRQDQAKRSIVTPLCLLYYIYTHTTTTNNTQKKRIEIYLERPDRIEIDPPGSKEETRTLGTTAKL